MRVAGLFTGVGGLESGLSAAGHDGVIFCEVSEAARAFLRRHFRDVPCARDIRNLSSLPSDIDIVVAGFPCQDLSQAGLTAGIRGERSGLVGHVFRLRDQSRAPWVLLENVSFMLHLQRGKALRTLVSEFERRGYRWSYRVVSSISFLPQRRERVLLLATNTDLDPADILLADDVTPPDTNTTLSTHAHGFYWTEGIRGLGWAPDAIPTLKNGSTIGIPSPPALLLPDGCIVTPDIRDAERLQGFPADWTVPATEVDRSSIRWSLVGNAVTVPVSLWLGRRLVSPGVFDAARQTILPEGARWPKAARFDGKQRWSVEIGMFPEWTPRPSIVKFLQYPGKPLSAKATRGFLFRMRMSKLRFVPGFEDLVRAHLERMEVGGGRSISETGSPQAQDEARSRSRSRAQRPHGESPPEGNVRGADGRIDSVFARRVLPIERTLAGRVAGLRQP